MNLRFFQVFLLFSIFACNSNPPTPTLLIQNVLLIDGTGSKPISGSLRIAYDKIIALGDLKVQKDDSVIDGRGLYLCPGFIDTHSHHDWSQDPVIEAAHSQGITTIVVGQDGGSHFPLQTYFDSLNSNPLSVNIASYAGHNTLRFEVMGQDYKRHATRIEMDNMSALLKREMEAGALGLSTGLEYDPGIYSDPEEVIALAKTLKPYGGRYISHIRSEDRYFESALEEIIHIGLEAKIPVQVSHMKLARKSLWGKVPEFIQQMDAARNEGVDISADVYPYEYWQSTMTVLFPERNFEDRKQAEYALTELTSPEGMIITRFDADSSYVGKTLAEIAQLRNQDPVSCYIDLIKISQQIPGESIVAKSMSEEDIFQLYQWPHTNVCSDGSSTGGHPRGWGSFPRFVDMMVKKHKLISIEEAVYKMTGLPAKHMGLEDRGVLKMGHFADMVLFDMEKLRDLSTFPRPQLASEGIEMVWVNGEMVFEDGESTGRLAGKVIRRKN